MTDLKENTKKQDKAEDESIMQWLPDWATSIYKHALQPDNSDGFGILAMHKHIAELTEGVIALCAALAASLRKLHCNWTTDFSEES